MKREQAPARTVARWWRSAHVLFAVALLFSLLDLVQHVRELGPGPVVLAALVTLRVICLIAWLIVARRPRHRVAQAVFFVTATAIFLSGLDGTGTMPMLLLAVGAIAVERGGQLASAAIAAVVAALAVVMIAVTAPLLSIVVEAAAVGLILLVAMLIGLLVRQVEQAETRAHGLAGDLSETNERLRSTNTELAEANTRLVQAARTERALVLADERARMSRELHDGLGHRLTLVGMSLDYALRMRDREPQRAWAEVGTAQGTSREALDLMRRWVRALHPAGEPSGRPAGLAWDELAEPFRGAGLEVLVEHRGRTLDLPAAAAHLGYRIVQESLTNVLRHATARQAWVEVVQDSDGLRLTVRDDGASTAATEGFGLRNLRERTEALGGHFTSGHWAQGGFEVTAFLPSRHARPTPRGQTEPRAVPTA